MSCSTVWDETQLLAAVDEMAAVVAAAATGEQAAAAAVDTDRVRGFIAERRGVILADLATNPPTPEPYPYPLMPLGAGTVEVVFDTPWDFGAGTVTAVEVDSATRDPARWTVHATRAGPRDALLLPTVPEPAAIIFVGGVDPDGTRIG